MKGQHSGRLHRLKNSTQRFDRFRRAFVQHRRCISRAGPAHTVVCSAGTAQPSFHRGYDLRLTPDHDENEKTWEIGESVNNEYQSFQKVLRWLCKYLNIAKPGNSWWYHSDSIEINSSQVEKKTLVIPKKKTFLPVSEV